MRSSRIILVPICLAAVGCQPQQTNIVRTARLPDGTELSYSNTSSGYFFNPNYTSDPGLGGGRPARGAGCGGHAARGSGVSDAVRGAGLSTIWPRESRTGRGAAGLWRVGKVSR